MANTNTNNTNNGRKKCGACQIAGHTVRNCTNIDAQDILHELMNEENIETAIILCRQMNTGHVLYSLYHGFNETTSGSRRKLIACVVNKFWLQTPPPSVPVPDLAPQTLSAFNPNEINYRYTSMLDEFRIKSLESDVKRRANHPGYLDATTSNDRHQEIYHIANRVISKLNANALTSGVGIDLYIRTTVNMTLTMYGMILEISEELFFELSISAILYVLTIAQVQNSSRMDALELQYQRDSIREQMSQQSGDAMKALKTVITCRPVQKKDPTRDPLPDMTCGICFDEFNPALIVQTGCGHDFCADCISGWARQRGVKSFVKCPCCREEINALTVGNKKVMKKVKAGLEPV